MRLTLDLSHHPWTRDRSGEAPAHTLAVARAADAAGIDAIWVSEDPEGWDAFALLGALATVTTRAALGTGVTSPYPRHANLLAASVATLDRLSGGRAVLGLGRGQVEWHRDALGVDTGEPLAVLAETASLLRAWWAPPHRASTRNMDNPLFDVRDWERVIHPRQARVPILLAAAGPRALALAGETFDGVIFNMLSSEEAIAGAIPAVRAAALAAGRDPADLAFVLRTGVVVVAGGELERKAVQRAKSLLALVAALPGMDRLVQTARFDVAAILGEVRAVMRTDQVLAAGGGFPALRREGDLAAAREIIPDELARHLGIIGPLPEVRSRLRELARLGITHVGVAPPEQATSMGDWRRLLGDLREGD